MGMVDYLISFHSFSSILHPSFPIGDADPVITSPPFLKYCAKGRVSCPVPHPKSSMRPVPLSISALLIYSKKSGGYCGRYVA